jgi:glutathione S-transferase
MSTKLYYFKFRGRAEAARLLFHVLEQPYEDVLVTKDGLKQLKSEGAAKLAFGALPMLEETPEGGDVFRLVQSTAILNYLARKHGLAPQDPGLAAQAEACALGAEDLRVVYFQLFGDEADEKQASFVAGRWREHWLPYLEGQLTLSDSGYMVGTSLTQADIAVWDALDAILIYVKAANLDGFPRVAQFYEQIKAHPPIAAYLASDRRIPD